MSGSSWSRLWDLFEQAVDLEPEQQEPFLASRCGSDVGLRARLEALIAADRQTRSALDQPLVPPELWQEVRRSKARIEEPELQPGQVLGSYRIAERIGQGGMGSVFLAEHVDASLARRAVVKVVRSDRDSAEIRRRLRAERSILAGLDHPNIARLYDSGAVEGGSPYFVQEFVTGETLDAYCARHQPDLEARLELFSRICLAVDHAHRHLVVHRDLKPTNILIDENGEPKLLDFGIAKVLDPPPGGGSADAPAPASAAAMATTSPQHRFLTPSYASPEQIRGGGTTTGSDVYSLGVILYQLLTGELPRRLEGRSLGGAELPDFERDPPAASSVSSEPALRGDLDAVVAKALRSDPSERYVSARDLARDLEYYRQGRPVSAREGTWRYLAGKFVRRHRRAVAAAAVAVLVLSGFSVGLSVLAHRVAAERDAAELEREHKTQVLDLVQEVFRLGSPYATRGRALSVREALEHSIPVLEKRLGDQPATRAGFQLVAGSILSDLGLAKAAAAPLDDALRFHREAGDRKALVRNLTKSASVKRRTGDLEGAESMVLEAVELARLVGREDPGRRARELLAGALGEWVSVLCHRHEYSAAAEPAREALALLEGLPTLERRRISVLELMARIESAAGDYGAAAELNARALDLRLGTDGPDHPSRVPALNNYGSNLRRMGDLEGAAAVFGEAIEIERASFGDDSGPHLPVLLSNLGGVSFRLGDFASAAELYEEALGITIRDSGEEHWLVFAFGTRLARARIHDGQAESAEPELVRLLEQWQPRLGEHWRWAEGRGLLGESLGLRGRCAEAELLLVSSFEVIVEKAGYNAKEQALERLRVHFERCGDPAALQPFAARLEAE